ncbi:MAG TPA: cob(I)yrinic acid a,c-diamide adenosyltransferase [Polyangiaceae bacterium]|jgi:cob(I)alamin adenosyltransferase|nr:cob(I)yrinic acid a,c-diamide adenosyltransferase [Polyangiaceae bacterium]
MSDERPPPAEAPAATFHDPHVTINRVYTKKGDLGTTSLVGGQKVEKSDLRIEAYGTVDELSAIVGASRQSAVEAAARAAEDDHRKGLLGLASTLLRIQHELFNLGSALATLPADLHPAQPRITDADVAMLEREMDAGGASLPTLRSFVLAGGSRLNADLHLARTVCRRAERCLVRLTKESEVDLVDVRYLNRLSDAFFVFSRMASALEGVPEVLWQPNAAASAAGASKPGA